MPSSSPTHEKSTNHKHSEAEPRTTARRNLTTDEIREAASKQVRRSLCDPDFLKEVAKRGLPVSANTQTRFKVVTGPEAASIYESFIESEDGHDEQPKQEKQDALNVLQRPVVFAFSVPNAGRKMVDYYMTWRGKTPKTHRLKGDKRKLGFLDAEFKKVAKTIEQEWKRMSQLGDAMKTPLGKSPLSNSALPAETAPAAPPPLPSQESAPAVLQTIDNDTDTLAPPRLTAIDLDMDLRPSSMASVTSLPLLGAIRGVPISNRLPLRVANPDPFSPTASARGSVAIDSPTAAFFPPVSADPAHAGNVIAVDVPKMTGEPVMPNTNNVTVETTPETPTTAKPRKSHRRKGEKKEGHSRKDKSGESSGASSNGHDSSSNNNYSNADEILICFVDDKHAEKAKKRVTWHSLEDKTTSNGAPVRRPSVGRQSPWNGPLLHASSGEISRFKKDSPSRSSSLSRLSTFINHEFPVHDDNSDSYDDDDDDDSWKEGPLIPMKTALAALGFLPSLSYDQPRRSYTPPSTTVPIPNGIYPPAPPPSYTSASPYSTPYSSPYVQTTAMPSNFAPTSTPYSSPYGGIPPQLYPPPGSVASLYGSPYAAPRMVQMQDPIYRPASVAGYASPYVPMSAYGYPASG